MKISKRRKHHGVGHSVWDDYRLGKKQVHRNLTIFPVLFSKRIQPYYLTLDQTIHKGVLAVTEIDARGNVNQLKLMIPSPFSPPRQAAYLVAGIFLEPLKQIGRAPLEALPCTAITADFNSVAYFIEALPIIMPLDFTGCC